MEIDKRKHKQVIDQIRQILLESWDPMEVQDKPESFDEYDSYVTHIFSLLSKGAKQEQLISYLSDVETSLMGLDEPGEEVLQPVAKQLLAVKVDVAR
jgi:hypothetical protein